MFRGGKSNNPNGDREVPDVQEDDISCLAWNPKANFLVAGSWNCQVRCWEVTDTNITPKCALSHDAPVLCSTWNAEGDTVFSGSCDNVVKKWDLSTDTNTVVAKHEAPVKAVFMMDSNILVTGSWDSTVAYWDMRTSGQVASLKLSERVYAMDVVSPLLVVGTADRRVTVVDLRNPTKIYSNISTPLKYQTRTIACFPDKRGFALGSIEGRCAVHYVDQANSSNNFAFKCHRDGNNIYSVNSISFHPRFGTFATVGADGIVNFWDKDSKQRLKQFQKHSTTISCGAFNSTGSLFAYAASYDWSKGSEFARSSGTPPQIFLHGTQDSVIAPRGSRSQRK